MNQTHESTYLHLAESTPGPNLFDLEESARKALVAALATADVADRSFEVIASVEDLDPEGGYLTQTKDFYKLVSSLVAGCNASLRLQSEDEIDPIEATPEQQIKYPVMLLAGEATALSFDDFRNAVRENPLLQSDLLSHKVLVACEAAPNGSDTDRQLSRPGIADFLSNQVSQWKPENWFDRLDAIDLLSIGSIRLKALRHEPEIHPTIIGDRFVAVQELHEKGKPKRQWLLRGKKVALDFRAYIRREIEKGTYIHAQDSVEILEELYAPKVIDELASDEVVATKRVPAGFETRHPAVAETLLYLGYLTDDRRALSSDGEKWVSNLAPYVAELQIATAVEAESSSASA